MKDLYESEKASLIMNLRGMGITNNKILNCIENIPRDIFIEPSLKKHAWENISLPIGMGQTISQPYIVALMTNELNLNGRELVLEIFLGIYVEYVEAYLEQCNLYLLQLLVPEY